MLSVFPIMFLSLLAHAILRVFVGGIFLYLSYQHLRTKRMELAQKLSATGVWILGGFELVLGVMFFVGVLTQIAALVAMALSLCILTFRHRFAHPAVPSPIFWVLLFAASSSLLITGAGALAVDLPI